MLRMRRVIFALAGLFGFFATVGLAAEVTRLELQSSAFAPNATIPMPYVCTDAGGAGKSPPLALRGTPASARTFAVAVRDPDAPGGALAHWVLYSASRRHGQTWCRRARNTLSPRGSRAG